MLVPGVPGLGSRHDLVDELTIRRGPRPVRLAERALNPLLGKSFVVYARKPC